MKYVRHAVHGFKYGWRLSTRKADRTMLVILYGLYALMFPLIIARRTFRRQVAEWEERLDRL